MYSTPARLNESQPLTGDTMKVDVRVSRGGPFLHAKYRDENEIEENCILTLKKLQSLRRNATQEDEMNPKWRSAMDRRTAMFHDMCMTSQACRDKSKGFSTLKYMDDDGSEGLLFSCESSIPSKRVSTETKIIPGMY